MRFTDLLNLGKKSEIPSSLNQLRTIGLRAFIAGINSVLPSQLLPKYVQLSEKQLQIGRDMIPRSDISKLIIIGGGKATAEMCTSLISILGDEIPFIGAINIPHGQAFPSKIYSPSQKSCIEVTFTSHPIPDEAGLHGVERMLEIIQNSPPNAIIIALISGGGSALMPLPAEGISLADKQTMNKLLIASGADIQEINCVRKHLSRFKGGQLSTAAYPRKVYSLILSDVIGNDLQTIASGPTVPDLTSFQKVDEICLKYQLYEKIPLSIRHRIEAGLKGIILETPKPDANVFDFTTNLIIGSAESSANVVHQELLKEKVFCEIYSDSLNGEAREYGKQLAEQISNFHMKPGLNAFIGTGEFTVILKGKGKGGRNQEMLLGFLNALDENPQYKAHQMSFVIISGAFDGIEGNSGAMGAVIDSASLSRIREKQLSIINALTNNNSTQIFQALDDLLITGQTGTNVNDMTLILIENKE